jgi:V/A-type H+-transporting ATPase subunit F
MGGILVKIIGICDKDTAVGLRLAGVKELYVPEDDATKIWNNLTYREDIGIVFINEKIAKDIGKTLKDYRLINNVPIVLEIPDKKGRMEDHMDFVSHLVKKAVGVEVNK